MKKPGLVLAAVLLIAVPSISWAQSLCPLNGAKSDKLACLIPQIYGAYGLGSGNGAPLLVNSHQAHFENDFLTSFTPINTAIGIQASQLPLASPTSGISFVYDPTLKTFSPSQESTLGPILGERAETIGRRRLYVAFSYQYFNFNSIDGQNTAGIPAVFEHQPEPNSGFPACPDQTGFPAKYAGQPCFVRDFIQTTTNVNLREHQFAFYATYGLTSRLDVSVVIPILSVNLDVASNATIVSNSVAPNIPIFPGQVFHQFDPKTVASCSGKPQPCLNATFQDTGSATGIGDVIFRGKYQLYKGEHLGFSIGTDVRTPTGDSTNYLGSGAWGVKPFGVISYRARVAPHLEVGYEVNGDSILAGDFVGTSANTKASLPDRFVYIAGVDVGIVKRISGAFDFIGERIIGGPQLTSSTYTDLGRCVDIACSSVVAGTTHPTIAVNTNTSYNESSASFGLKFRPTRNLIITGNALVRLDDSGLKSSVVPLVGISYSF
ncbi:MAG: transporter [Terriglobales bacterium]